MRTYSDVFRSSPIPPPSSRLTMADQLLRRASCLSSRCAVLRVTALLIAPIAPITALAQTPSAVTLSAPTTLCERDITGQVTLSAPAPATGSEVQFASSFPAVVPAPTAVTVPAGATSAPFRIPRCTPTSQAVAVTIGATAGGETQSAILNVLAPTLKSITFKTNLTTPISFTGAATLQGPAPAGGVIVTLSSSQPALLAPPASVTIAAGASSTNFSMAATSAVSQATAVTITGTGLGATVSANATVPTAVPMSMVFGSGQSPTSTLTMPSGSSTSARLTLNSRAGPSGLAITLTSSNGSIATVPTGVTVPPGDSVAQFTVTTVGQSQPSTVTIAATVGSTTVSGMLTLTGTTLTSFSVSPNPVIAGLATQGRVSSSRAAGPGGFSVRFTSSSGELVQLPAIVTIPEGASTATFPVPTRYADAPRTISISATGGGVTQSTSLTLTPEGISAFSIAPTRVIGGSTVTGRLSAPFGHDGFTVTLVSDNPDIAIAPGKVIFTAQDTTKTFAVTSNPTRVVATARITATVAASPTDMISKTGFTTVRQSRTAELVVAPPTIRSITMTPLKVIGGSSTVITGTVTLTGPAALGMGVSLTSTDPAVGVPTAITFIAGSTTATFTSRTLAVTADKDVTVRARIGDELGGASTTVRVTVKP